MMANVPHVTAGLGLREFQADGFLLTRVYNINIRSHIPSDTLPQFNIRIADVIYSSCNIIKHRV